MAVAITVNDERPGVGVAQWKLELPEERLTVRELIRSRVFQEVKDYNMRLPELFRGLVQPSEAEQMLNGYKLPQSKRIDWQRQFEKAIEAFDEARILLLVDDRQLDDLDEELLVDSKTIVTFLKLVPLAGG
jgi:hypothetical protein